MPRTALGSWALEYMRAQVALTLHVWGGGKKGWHWQDVKSI